MSFISIIYIFNFFFIFSLFILYYSDIYIYNKYDNYLEKTYPYTGCKNTAYEYTKFYIFLKYLCFEDKKYFWFKLYVVIIILRIISLFTQNIFYIDVYLYLFLECSTLESVNISGLLDNWYVEMNPGGTSGGGNSVPPGGGGNFPGGGPGRPGGENDPGAAGAASSESGQENRPNPHYRSSSVGRYTYWYDPVRDGEYMVHWDNNIGETVDIDSDNENLPEVDREKVKAWPGGWSNQPRWPGPAPEEKLLQKVIFKPDYNLSAKNIERYNSILKDNAFKVYNLEQDVNVSSHQKETLIQNHRRHSEFLVSKKNDELEKIYNKWNNN